MRIILIKHGRPVVDPAAPSHEWVLSEQARQDVRRLAGLLRPHQPTQIVSSVEPKAMQTAELIGEELGVGVEPLADLHEHDRRNVPHMRSSEFISHMELFFRKPDELVLGRETASACLQRFERAVESAAGASTGGNLAIVSHGTVIALYLAKLGAGRAFDLWRQMGLPSYAVIGGEPGQVLQLVERL